MFESRESLAACTQFCVSLVAVESIPVDLAGNKGVKKASSKAAASSRPEERIIHGTASEVCIGLETTSFELHVPDHATPSFKSNLGKSTRIQQ